MKRRYTAYFDESGDKSVRVFAGFVAANDQWDRFEPDWNRVLARFSAPPLHMRTFAHSRDEFSAWKGDEKKRADFLRSLIGVIKLRTRTSFASAVLVDDFNDVAKRYPDLGAQHTPFSIAGNACLVKLARWAERSSISPEDVAVLFEDGASEKKVFVRHALSHLHFRPSFAAKSEFAAFQAADLLAFEFLLSIRAVYAAQAKDRKLKLSEFRKPLQALIDGQPSSAEAQWGIHEKGTLERSCIENTWNF
jgi:hypothetical protein